jgi:hypothetical protein
MRLKKRSKFLTWQPRWFKLDFVSLTLEYFADAECCRRLGSIAFNSNSRHELQSGVLSLSNVAEVTKGRNKDAYMLRHNDLRVLEWWDETFRLAEQQRKLRPQSNH